MHILCWRDWMSFPAAWWWQCLIVCAYTLGLRKSDLANIEMSNINLENDSATGIGRENFTE